MTEKTVCSRCGKPAAGDDQIGLCNDCLLAVGLGSVVDATAAGRDARFVPPEVSEIAPYFPQLDVSELLGCGGMGAVYKARQKNLDRLVALKILPPDIGSAPAFAERFAREAKALAKLNHPNIVTLYEFGQAGELFYFLMEYVDGVNLGQLLRSGRVSPREALAIVPQICDALQYAHDAGIVHRDIKPENILLDRKGRVKVADFGLAKLVGSASSDGTNGTKGTDGRGEVVTTTEAGHVMGTPQYMAPEQVAHPSDVDHRADIYSLGVVFYQMLTGELPKGDFAAPSKKVVVDVRLDEVVLRAMEKRPELRYQHVSDVKTMVETIASTPPLATPPATPVGTGGAPVREKPDLISELLLFSPIVGVRNGRRVIHWAGWRSNGILSMGVMAVVFVPAVLSGEHISGWLVSLFLFVLGMIVAGAVRDCRKPIEQFPPLDNKAVGKNPPTFAVFGSLYLALVVVLMVSASTLPDRVACHFGLDGNADDWMGRVPYLLLIGAIPAVLAFLFALVSRRIRTAGASFVNIPRRDYWLAPERRDRTAALIRDRLTWLLCLLTLFFGSLHVLTVAANRTSPPHLNMGALLVVVIVFLVALMQWLFMLVMRFAEADDKCSGTAPPQHPIMGKSGAADFLSLDETTPSHFSRTAIVGACWIAFGLIPVILFALAKCLAAQQFRESPVQFIFHVLGNPPLLALAATFGTTLLLGPTLLGWIAVRQIRRSEGKLYGLGLAVFDGLLLPLLALDTLLLAADLSGRHHVTGPGLTPGVTMAQLNIPGWPMLLVFGLLIIVDWLVIRAVWHAVHKPVKNGGLAPIAVPPRGGLGKLIACAAVSLSLGIVGMNQLSDYMKRQDAATGKVVPALSGRWFNFGPVIERTVTNMIDFDTGALIDFPLATQPAEGDDARYGWINGQNVPDGKKPNKESYPWMRAHGVDAVEINHDLENICLMLVARLEDRDWDVALTPAGGKKLLALTQAGAASESFNGLGTYAIRTREGGLGIVQITDQNLPRGVKLRYRLLAPDTKPERSRFPKAAHLSTQAGTVIVHHDDVDVQYVLFATNAARFASADKYVTMSDVWVDHGSVKLTERQSFVYHREATDPFHLQLNGTTCDLSQGRVIVLHGDGSIEQLKLFPPLAVANSPDKLVKLFAAARAMNTEPVTPEKLHAQLAAAESQLDDLLKAHAEDKWVLDVRRAIDALRNKLVQGGATNAPAAKPAPAATALQTSTATEGDLVLAGQPPVVVETFPASGVRDVEPGEKEIRVRFSKPMAGGSWSWCDAWSNSLPAFVGLPHYESDSRTCVLKANLDAGHTYAFWLNSEGFRNFTDKSGHPAVPYLLIFQTKQK